MATVRRAGFSLRSRARSAALAAENAALRRELAVSRATAAELAARYEELDLMLDTVPALLAYGDADFNIAHANRAMATWWGYEKDDVVGKHLTEVMLPGGFDDALPFMLQARGSGRIVTHERSVVGRDGQTHILRQSYAPHIDDTGEVRGYAGVVLDITEERRAEETLRESAQRAAVLEERNRLARELHDAATQTIYSAMLIAEALPQVYERSPEEGRRNLTKLRQLVRGGLAEMRSLLFELRPWTLEAVALPRLLEYLRDSLTGRTRINLEWDVEAADDPPAPTKAAIYRIAQEAFNNIVKHARAGRVMVKLRCDSESGRLTVEDDGRGFDPATVAGERMGLSIMCERTEGMGGVFKVTSVPGEGTRVEVIWGAQEVSDA